MTADRPQLKKLAAVLAHSDVVIVAAVDRLSRDTTDLLDIARDMQRTGAGIRSLAEPYPRYHVRLRRDRSRDSWRCRQAGISPHQRSHGARPCRREGEGRDIRAQAEAHPAPAARSHPAAQCGGGNAALHRAQLQCQRADDFEVGVTAMRVFSHRILSATPVMKPYESAV